MRGTGELRARVRTVRLTPRCARARFGAGDLDGDLSVDASVEVLEVAPEMATPLRAHR
jgi:hypothetical protein